LQGLLQSPLQSLLAIAPIAPLTSLAPNPAPSPALLQGPLLQAS